MPEPGEGVSGRKVGRTPREARQALSPLRFAPLQGSQAQVSLTSPHGLRVFANGMVREAAGKELHMDLHTARFSSTRRILSSCLP